MSSRFCLDCRRSWGRPTLWCALALVALMATGCVRRRLTIRSNPPGALAYVDDQEVGFTPVSVPFTYYGTRKIQLVKAGYRTETVYRSFWPTWYQIPGVDFFSENVVPFELRDEREVDVALVPQPIVPKEQLIQQAQDLRSRALPPGVAPPPSFVPTAPPTDFGSGLPRSGLAIPAQPPTRAFPPQ